MIEKSAFLQAGLDAVEAAAEIIKHYYSSHLQVELKQDRSPVTIADIESEMAIKKIISGRFPEHGFWGEESGRDNTECEYCWLIDPIDGTKSFVRGYPFFSTQIALMQHDQIVLGVSNAPLFGELAYAERGKGAVLNGEAIKVSAIEGIADAALSLGNIASLAGSPQWANLGKLLESVYRIRGYGDFYHYHLLAAGKIEAVLESDVNILDIAALSVIVSEAGGVMTDLSGGQIDLQTTSILAANSKAMHADVLQRLK